MTRTSERRGSPKRSRHAPRPVEDPTRSQTLSDEKPERRGAPASLAWVAVVARYDDALSPPGLACVVPPGRDLSIGRGSTTGVIDARAATLRLDLADPWASSTHAHFDGRCIEDRGSRNGMLVNGVRKDAHEIRDGDLVEVGHTLLKFGHVAADRAADLLALLAELGDSAAASLSTTLLEEVSRARRVADSHLPLLVLGETGSGKEEMARSIHRWSGRSADLVAVNCATIPTNLAEGELFGYRRGAFTGAERDRVGLLAAADGGTLLLDEVDALSLEMQPKLLRFLQDKRVRRLGETSESEIDVRILAASNAPLAAAVAEGRFRADLYARLSGLVVEIPPLRERMEDLGLLVARLLRRHATARPTAPRMTPEAWRVLLRRRWPQNVRELERCLEAALLLCGSDGAIDASHVAPPRHESLAATQAARRSSAEGAAQVPARARRSTEQAETDLRAALAEHGPSVAAVARALGVSRMQVYRWMERFEIRPSGDSARSRDDRRR